jgi:ABC-type multidrug transport system fused ATPase/permease subunit
VHDYVNNVATVLTLRLQSRAATVLKERIVKPFDLFILNIRLEECKWGIISIIMSIVIAGSCVYWIYIQDPNAPVAIASLYMVFDYLRRISDSIYTFAWRYADMVYQSVDVRSAIPIEEAYLKYFTPQDETATQVAHWKRIELKELSYLYSGSDKKALDHIEFVFEKGKKIAIVGESGSGKSTFMSVIRGMHRANTICLRIDGAKAHGPLSILEDSIELLPQMPGG